MTKKTIRSKPKKLLMQVQLPREELEYDEDFFKWTKKQAHLLKKRAFEELDIDNLIEEIESLGKSDRRALKSHLIILLQHKLKIEFSEKNSVYGYYINSWNSSVRDATREIDLILQDSPSLKPELNKYLEVAYQYAKEKAAQEMNTNPKIFPKDCPWSIKSLL